MTNPWLRSFLDLECFVLSGMLAKDTICAGEECIVTQNQRGEGCTMRALLHSPQLLHLHCSMGGSTCHGMTPC